MGEPILISTQVVTKLVQQMMEKAQDGDQEGLLAALAGQEGMPGMPGGGMPGMPTNPQEQMAALRELVDSGQLTDDDKREIKKMFAESRRRRRRREDPRGEQEPGPARPRRARSWRADLLNKLR